MTQTYHIWNAVNDQYNATKILTNLPVVTGLPVEKIRQYRCSVGMRIIVGVLLLSTAKEWNHKVYDSESSQ